MNSINLTVILYNNRRTMIHFIFSDNILTSTKDPGTGFPNRDSWRKVSEQVTSTFCQCKWFTQLGLPFQAYRHYLNKPFQFNKWFLRSFAYRLDISLDIWATDYIEPLCRPILWRQRPLYLIICESDTNSICIDSIGRFWLRVNGIEL